MDLKGKYRLVTRSDFDGLVCVAILKKMNIDIDSVLFVHPKDMQDKKIDVKENDITINLPYVEGVYMAFDHHLSETIRVGQKKNCIIDPNAPSTARVIYEYFKYDYNLESISIDMLNAVDKADSGHFEIEDILTPKGYPLLNFIIDPRTGLDRFKNFSISNYNLMLELINHIENLSIEEILKLDDFKERIDTYFEYEEKFKEQINKISKINKNLLILDYRNEELIYPGNRFLSYAMFQDINVSLTITWGKEKQNIVVYLGKSIFKRDAKVNIGLLMLEYGGGGHDTAGACQLMTNTADREIEKIIEAVTRFG